MSLAKLDTFDYTILPGVIRFSMLGMSDPSMVDILSEIENSSNVIFIEGHFYEYLDYSVVEDKDGVYLELKVALLTH